MSVLGFLGRFSENCALTEMEFRKQVVFPRETLVVSWKGLWGPSPLVNTFSPSLPTAVGRGPPSSLCRRSGPEADTGWN